MMCRSRTSGELRVSGKASAVSTNGGNALHVFVNGPGKTAVGQDLGRWLVGLDATVDDRDFGPMACAAGRAVTCSGAPTLRRMAA